MTARLHDWQTRFAEFARARRSQPFEWGVNDCCLFAADAVEAITGEDPAVDLRGYTTAAEAARILKERGGMEAMASSLVGPSVSPLMANVGDIVLLEMDGRDALGICNGNSILGPGPDGLVCCGMGLAKAAWRIG